MFYNKKYLFSKQDLVLVLKGSFLFENENTIFQYRKINCFEIKKMTNRKKTQEEVARLFEQHGSILIGEYVGALTPVEYKCKCGIVRKQQIGNFLNHECRSCLELISEEETVIPEGVEDTIDEQTGEVYKRILGGWVSSFGRAKNLHNTELTLSSRGTFSINKKHQYVTRLVARAFQIPGYENLGKKGYIVTRLDKNKSNNRVENLKVVHQRDIDYSNSKKKCLKKDVDVTGLEYKVINMFPKYKIYENGEIYNGKRFFKFGETTYGYLSLCVTRKEERKHFLVHRVVCYAFHPIEGLDEFEDYAHLQVNHKDGEKSNNCKDNLEWATRSENNLHAHRTKLNPNSRAVVQLEKGRTKILGEYYSIKEASRQTGESEHNIKYFLKGQSSGMRKYESFYEWKYTSNEDEDEIEIEEIED